MVRIITDGTSDLSVQRGLDLNVHVMPMRVFFGQDSFVDGVDITREEFFARLTSGDVRKIIRKPREQFFPRADMEFNFLDRFHGTPYSDALTVNPSYIPTGTSSPKEYSSIVSPTK